MHTRRSRARSAGPGAEAPPTAPETARNRRALATLRKAARELIWLYERRQGDTVARIAGRAGVSAERVEAGLRRAQAREPVLAAVRDLAGLAEALGMPRVLPIFPVGPFTPGSRCPHRGPIPPGSSLCCMVCHASGMDR